MGVTPNIAMLGREVLLPASLIARPYTQSQSGVRTTIPFVADLRASTRGTSKAWGPASIAGPGSCYRQHCQLLTYVVADSEACCRQSSPTLGLPYSCQLPSRVVLLHLIRPVVCGERIWKRGDFRTLLPGEFQVGKFHHGGMPLTPTKLAQCRGLCGSA